MLYLGRQTIGLNAITKVVAPPEPALKGKDVKFRDYDGAVLYSYTPEEIASMSVLPPLPTSLGLTCLGWNWTLLLIKDYVASYGKCEIGAVYTTDDGKTRIKLTIQDPKYTTIPIVFQLTVANGVDVDWGDGSLVLTYSSTSQLTISHAYSPTAYPATYTVTFKVNSGTMSFPTNIMGKSGYLSDTNTIIIWLNMIDIVLLGNKVTSIGNNAFNNCYSLASITIPSGVTSIGTQVFYNCLSLASITIPPGITSIGNLVFANCYSLASITIPPGITSIRNLVFNNCYSLASITIPSGVTSIGNNVYENCYSLVSITIPFGVTSIGTFAFNNCYSLASITIPFGVTSIGNLVFVNCYSLASITIPSSVITIYATAFKNCLSLASITIPSGVTSIGNYAFNNCLSLASITIPSGVTNIGTLVFYGCAALATFDFRAVTSIPILNNVNSFQITPKNKEIIVPDALYDDWIIASNWSSTTNNIVGSIVKASESSLGPL